MLRRFLPFLFCVLVRGASAVGVPDPDFQIGLGPDGPVLAVLPLPNGQILVGGLFTTFDGVNRPGLVRLQENGSVDPAFDAMLQPLEGERAVTVLHADAQGRVYVGGVFAGAASTARPGLFRLDAQGGFDPTFVPALPSPAIVASLALAADGDSLWVGGLFPGDGVAHSLWRLQLNGSAAPGFVAPVFRADDNAPFVYSILASPSGAVTVGGEFREAAGRITVNVARFHADGRIDPDYSAGRLSSPGVVNDVVSAGEEGAVLLASEEFSSGVYNPGAIMRRTADGALDDSFGFPISEALGGNRPIVNRIWRFADGRYLVAGNYGRVRGEPHAFLTRIFADSAVDETFTASPNDEVIAVAEDAQERILVSGLFTKINGQPAPGLARLLRTGDVPVVRSPPANAEAILGGVARIPAGIVGGTTYTWSKDGVVLFTSSTPELALVSASHADAGTYTLRAGNRFGAVDLEPVVIQVNAINQARLDPSMDVAEPTLTQPNRNWTRLADGRWLTFDRDQLRLQVYTKELRPVEQVSLAGVLRSTLATAIAAGPSGDVWIAGAFEIAPGDWRGLIHVNADGSLDPAFTVPDTAEIDQLALASDGRVYATSRWRTRAYDRFGTPVPGQTDLTGMGFTLRSDGRYYLNTTWPHGYGRLPVVRYHSDGTEDRSFTPPQVTVSGEFGPTSVQTVTDFAALPDGGLVVAGYGDSTTGARLIWLEANGRLRRLHDAPSERWYIHAVTPAGGVLASCYNLSRSEDLVYFAPDGSAPLSVLPLAWPAPPIQAWADDASITLLVGPPGAHQQRAAYRLLLPIGRGTSRLVNLSGRGYTGPGEETLIVGYVTAGAAPGEVLVRGVGPGLRAFNLTGTADDPLLTLYRGPTRLEANDDWDVPWEVGARLVATAERHGAFALEGGRGDAALASDQPAAAYTAHVDAADAPGVALGEIYANTPGSHRLVNLSLRGVVGTDARSLIGGFIVTGDRPRWMLLRAIGPTLHEFNVAGAVSDPSMNLVMNGRVIATNDDWSDDGAQPVIEAAARKTGAFALPPGSGDAALLVELSPGTYTCVVTPTGEAAPGVGLLEIYHLD